MGGNPATTPETGDISEEMLSSESEPCSELLGLPVNMKSTARNSIVFIASTDNRNGDQVPSDLINFYSSLHVLSLAHKLAAYYGVNACLISLVGKENEISTVARYGLETKTTCEVGLLHGSRLCKMRVKRGAPVIVMSASESHLSNDPLVAMTPAETATLGIPVSGIEFFVELCLRLPSGRWCGTLCLADDQPRTSFCLKEVDQLKAVGMELVQVLQDLGFDDPGGLSQNKA